jgi:hypothetical protein
MSRPQVLHMLLRIKPESFRKLIAISKSINNYVKNSLFTAPSTPNAARPKEWLGANGVAMSSCLKWAIVASSDSTISTSGKET